MLFVDKWAVCNSVCRRFVRSFGCQNSKSTASGEWCLYFYLTIAGTFRLGACLPACLPVELNCQVATITFSAKRWSFQRFCAHTSLVHTRHSAEALRAFTLQPALLNGTENGVVQSFRRRWTALSMWKHQHIYCTPKRNLVLFSLSLAPVFVNFPICPVISSEFIFEPNLHLEPLLLFWLKCKLTSFPAA